MKIEGGFPGFWWKQEYIKLLFFFFQLLEAFVEFYLRGVNNVIKHFKGFEDIKIKCMI